MKNSKFAEEAKLHPTRIYARPQDVLRDRRLNDIDRLEVLTAWERQARHANQMEESATGVRLQDVVQARLEIEERLPSDASATAPAPKRQ